MSLNKIDSGFHYLVLQTSISKKMIPSVKYSVLYENRYCNQDEFDISVFEGRSKSSSTNEVFTKSCP